MRNPSLRTPFGAIELRPAAPAPGDHADMRVYVLLPELDELVGIPGFGLAKPIRVPAEAAQRRPSALRVVH